MKTTLIKLTFAALTALCLQASASTIGFEGVVPDDDLLSPVTPYTEAGFTLTDNNTDGADAIFGKNAVNSNGSAVFFFCSTDCEAGTIITISASDSALFSLTGLSSANFQEQALPITIDVIGHLFDGTTVQTSLTSTENWTAFTFAGFEHLTSVDISATGGYGVLLDNIDVNKEVPEPASLALMGLGLLAAGAVRRRMRPH